MGRVANMSVSKPMMAWFSHPLICFNRKGLVQVCSLNIPNKYQAINKFSSLRISLGGLFYTILSQYCLTSFNQVAVTIDVVCLTDLVHMNFVQNVTVGQVNHELCLHQKQPYVIDTCTCVAFKGNHITNCRLLYFLWDRCAAHVFGINYATKYIS